MLFPCADTSYENPIRPADSQWLSLSPPSHQLGQCRLSSNVSPIISVYAPGYYCPMGLHVVARARLLRCLARPRPPGPRPPCRCTCGVPPSHDPPRLGRHRLQEVSRSASGSLLGPLVCGSLNVPRTQDIDAASRSRGPAHEAAHRRPATPARVHRPPSVRCASLQRIRDGIPVRRQELAAAAEPRRREHLMDILVRFLLVYTDGLLSDASEGPFGAGLLRVMDSIAL